MRYSCSVFPKNNNLPVAYTVHSTNIFLFIQQIFFRGRQSYFPKEYKVSATKLLELIK